MLIFFVYIYIAILKSSLRGYRVRIKSRASFHNFFRQPSSFDPIVIPQPHPYSQVNNISNHKLNSKANNKCINRTLYRSEFARIFDKDIDIPALKNPHILIIGGSTVLGSSLKRQFIKENIPTISINGINEIDFSTNDSYTLLDIINIKEAYIAYQPPLIRHTFSDGFDHINHIATNYIDGISNYLEQHNIPFIFAVSQPVFPDVVKSILRHQGTVIEMPFLVDTIATKDIENPTMRAVRECRSAGYSNIEYYPYLTYQSITSDDAAQFVIKHLKNNTRNHILLQGNSSIDIKTAVNIAVKSNGIVNCKIHFKKYSHKIPKLKTNIIKEKIMKNNRINDVELMLKKQFSDFANPYKYNNIYLSIVFTGRHDNYSNNFETRVQNLLKSINNGIKTVPLAKVEVIIVDYATPTNNTLLHSILKIPKHLKKNVRFIIVPPIVHQELETKFNVKYPFFEYIAKNIGIRRSNAKFVLTTNGDSLFSTELFELIASRQFNSFVSYRGNRWDLNENTINKNITINKMIKMISETWKLKNMDIYQRCIAKNNFAILDSCDKYKENAEECVAGDFILLSKELWNVMKGFNEVPMNPNNDMVFIARLMKLLPGYAQMFVRPIYLHQYHERIGIKRGAFPNEEDVKNDYCCTGKCFACKPYYDDDEWGLPRKKFVEVRK